MKSGQLGVGTWMLAVLFWQAGLPPLTRANSPGGTNGAGASVTVINNGNGTVTMENGIVSILCTTAGATINQINYTYDNGGGATTTQLLNGGYDGGQLYWELGGFGSGTFTYTPVATGGNYGELDLLTTSTTNGAVDIHFSMLRGSPGFYVTAIWSHRAADGAMTKGETRDNIYAGSIFDWMSVDAARNRLMEVSPTAAAVGVFNAPVEVSLWTNGLYQGRYEDKYKYSADFGTQRAWGWSSVGAGGRNVGLWNVSASVEYYGGGPMKRELMCHIGTTILNMLHGSHYGGGTDGSWNAGEVWTMVYGPYFIYCNHITNTVTDLVQASAALYADALAQAVAEKTAWPYSWFTNANYLPASGRGTVTGKFVVADSGNPNASPAGLWVGAVRQPVTTDGVYDFQEWCKPYQFWTKTDSNGVFTIPAIIATNNYTLYAFGPGAAGTFQSQALGGGAPPNSINIPSAPFSVTVTEGATNDLGTITWTPTRVGATVFEIGVPDRTPGEFRHGDDFWVSDPGPNSNAPGPIWGKYLDYPVDFPDGPNYVVGQSRWSTDWNYVQPVVTDAAGNFDPSTSTITFSLASAPSAGAQASFYIATASDFQGALIIQVNGNNLAGTTGYFPAYNSSASESDTTIREGLHGMFSDNRITFAASYLRAGQNTITIQMRKGGYFANHAIYDYIRLELTGYVPPAPATVSAFPANTCNLVKWPVVPGANSYNVLRSNTISGGFTTVGAGLVGPVCGSGTNDATWVDTNAADGAAYYYIVQSVNQNGTSASSPVSGAAAPSASLPASAPAAPAGLTATAGNAQVTLNWSASPGANYYAVLRSTVVNSNGTVAFIMLNNTNTTASYVDASACNGDTCLYVVTAGNAAGMSGFSAGAAATPLPPPPAAPPGSFAVTVNTTSSNKSAVLNWSAVSGAVGYIIERSTDPSGPFTFPNHYVMSITETTYTDAALPLNTAYYYAVTAVNAGGVSSASTVKGTSLIPAAPAELTAAASNAAILLNWTPSPGATNYIIQRGTNSGGENTTLASSFAGANYTDSGLVNGVAYFYLVAANAPGGNGPWSPEAEATPSAPVTNSPTLLAPALAGGGWVIGATGGAAGARCYLLSSSNIALPLSNWTPVTTNLFDPDGNFLFTNPFPPGLPQVFYRLELPGN